MGLITLLLALKRQTEGNKKKGGLVAGGGGGGVERLACQLHLEQLDVLARRYVKAPFLFSSELLAFSVSLVSTLLGDNGAFWRVSSLA